jgi:hypothetical protein
MWNKLKLLNKYTRDPKKILLENLRGEDYWEKTHRWEGNIKMELQETRWENIDWIRVFHDRNCRQALVNTLMNFQVSKEAGNFLTS